MLEAMTELDKDIEAGKKAERRLKELRRILIIYVNWL